MKWKQKKALIQATSGLWARKKEIRKMPRAQDQKCIQRKRKKNGRGFRKRNIMIILIYLFNYNKLFI